MIRKIAQRTGLALAALAAIVSATGQARATILNFDDLIWATSLNSGNSNLTAQVHNMLDPTSTVTTSPANFTMGIYQLTSVSGVSPNRKALVTLLNSNAYDGLRWPTSPCGRQQTRGSPTEAKPPRTISTRHLVHYRQGETWKQLCSATATFRSLPASRLTAPN